MSLMRVTQGTSYPIDTLVDSEISVMIYSSNLGMQEVRFLIELG